jgi:hypothetical protein
MRHIHHLWSNASTIGKTVTDIPSGLSLTPPQELISKVRLLKLSLHQLP